MKILQVIPIFSPPYLFGGSQQVAYLQSKELCRRGHEVVIYTSDMKNPKERVNKSIEKVNGVKIIHFKNLSTLLSYKTGLIVTPKMIEDLKKEIKSYDVIHIHEARGFQHMVAWKCARESKVPYIVQAHGNLSPVFKGIARRVYDEFFGKKIMKDSSGAIAVSRSEVKDYMRLGVPKEKVEVIPNPIDIKEFDNTPVSEFLRKKYGIPHSSKIILFMGRVHFIKGVDILLYAFARMIKKKGVNATLVISGPDDGYMSKCFHIVREYNLNNVIFTGQLNNIERVYAYKEADLVVLPSRYETFGMTVLEAYACSKPVIASKVGGLIDLVVEGETGLLVDPENILKLSEAMEFMLLSDTKNMSNAARKFVEKFSIIEIVNNLEKFYYKVINGTDSSK
jgi:glycosyltransferase involved in cell wall biosynthesis